jgi:hypothetical protein
VGEYAYVTSYEILKYDDHYIELVEKFPCADKAELHKREGEVIRANPCVNKCIPGRTRAEYHKEYYVGAVKDKKKARYQDNADKIKADMRQYYQDNIEKIKARDSEKHTCPCGGKYRRSDKSKHFRTAKHKKYEYDNQAQINAA